MFSTGALHALVMNKRVGSFETYPLASAFSAAELSAAVPKDVPQGARLQVVASQDGPLWYWHQLVQATAQEEHAHHGHAAPRTLNAAYFHATTGDVVDPEAYWLSLAQTAAGQTRLQATKAITGFSPNMVLCKNAYQYSSYALIAQIG